MRTNQFLISAFLGIGMLATSGTSVAGGGSSSPPDDPACGATCCYTVPDMETSGDLYYGPGNWDWCRQSFLNDLVDGYGMKKEHWDGGFGWNDACNMEKPFARTLVARVALATAHPDPPSDWKDWSGPILRWGDGWAWERVDKLDADCSNGRSDATQSGRKKIILHLLGRPASDGTKRMGFFHRLNVPSRSALLLHEARHIKFGSHTGSEQRDSNWDEFGPYHYQAAWLMQYAGISNPATTTQALRCAAQDSAIGVMYGDARDGQSGDGWAFVTHPDPNLRPDVPECR